MLCPYVCHKLFEGDDVKPFDITQMKGYWNQEILRYMHSFSPSKGQSNSPVSDDAIRPKKRHRPSKDDDGCTDGKELRDATDVKGNSSWEDIKKTGNCSLRQFESVACLSKTETVQIPSPSLEVGSEVEVLCQDSGIRGCWFRASIIKKHKDKVKVRYQDIKDADDEAKCLEEWISPSRVAVADQFGARSCGRTIIRPCPPTNEDRVSRIVDVGTAVDVWRYNGWWEGIVVQKESEDRIHVYFPGENLESVFGYADVRHSQEWLRNVWMHIKERPDILTSIPSRLEAKQGLGKSDETTFSQPAACDTVSQLGRSEAGCGTPLEYGMDKGKESGAVADLSKDGLLVQWGWKCSKKRRRGGGTPSRKLCHEGSIGNSSPEAAEPEACERFRASTALKVDHDNCKYMRDSLFNSNVVKPLTSLVMSRG